MGDLFGIELDALASSFQPPNESKLFGVMPSTTSKSRSLLPVPTTFSIPPLRKSKFKMPKLKAISIPTEEGCIHEVVLPTGLDCFKPMTPISQTPAKTYPFKLDPFQRQAILCIENDQSVLVSAHTSAGKTVVAEYAIARCLANKQRVIYTTPIKALSNQKFREFSAEFKDVGLMTGDITINPESTLLIMTTEILRSMLYRGSEVTRELGWVIFDEIHYMREKERGVVWEESIILLPDSVLQVFLSATIPNARQFAEWIAFLHKRPCHVIYTDYRPTPLQHYVYPCGGDGIFLVVNQKREFLEVNFNSALDVIRRSAGNAKSDASMRGRRGGSLRNETYCYKLVKLVMDQKLEPLIVFSFSKRDCEFYASQLSKMNFNDAKDKAAIDLIVKNALESLSLEDQKLPQILHTIPMVRRGIGIHHGGLLPIIKEIVEILFSEGYLKVLFATETFAMGLNMPARTVLFTATRKFDGRDFRHISPGEYIQMSGRAGRRGKDDRGTVILMLDDTVTPDAAKQLLLGTPDPLNSAFTLSYNMVLSLLLVEEINPQIMLKKSFFQFQNYASIPDLERKIEKLNMELNDIDLPENVDFEQLSGLLQLRRGIEDLENMKWQLSMKFKYISPFLQPGRLLRVVNENGVDYGWAVVLNLRRSKQNNPGSGSPFSDTVLVDVLIRVAGSGSDNSVIDSPPLPLSFFKPIDEFDVVASEGESTDETMGPPTKKVRKTTKTSSKQQNSFGPIAIATVVSVPLDFLRDVSSVCLNFSSIDGADTKDPTLLVGKMSKLPSSMRLHFWEGINRAKTKLGGELPLLDPVEDLGVKDTRLAACVENIHLLEARAKLNPLYGRDDSEYLLCAHEKRIEKYLELRIAHDELDKKESLLQLDELHSRKRVLRRLGFCTEDDVIHLKGRIACEISSGDELMLTELLLDGFFNTFSADQIAGALSCFVAEKSNSKDPIKLRPDMETALRTIRSKAQYLATVAEESRVRSGPMTGNLEGPIKGDGAIFIEGGRSAVDDYVSKFSGEMMEVVRSWAQGVPFAKLCQMTPLFEGNVIRCLRRLEELLRQMHEAAKVAGNTDLENKFVKAMTLIKRDIVFAASLYL